MTWPADRDLLRRQMRARRRSLSARERAAAATQLPRVIDRALLLRPGMNVAVYIAHGHEADLRSVIELVRRRNCSVYLPAITNYRSSRMDFVKFDPSTSLRANRFGIPEPDLRVARRIPVRHLDLILIPLVAFDSQGWRLGSGAGFYDRRLHHLRTPRRWRRPKLIGVGYEFQRAAQIEPAPWDVPLDAILTEKNLYPAQRTSARNHTRTHVPLTSS